MGAWGNGNFENDRALDHVYRLLNTIAARVEKMVAKLPRQKSPDFDSLLADVELLGVIARHVYKPASFTWVVRGELLPDHLTIRQWKAVVLRAWDRDRPPSKDTKSAEDEANCRRVIAGSFDQLARLSRRQIFGALRTCNAYMKELFGDGYGIDAASLQKYEQQMRQRERELKEKARAGDSNAAAERSSE
jgi:hypothetical protein